MFLTFLGKLDKFAEPVSLNYQGREKFSTIGGSIISIMIWIVIIVYGVGRGDQLVNRKHPPVLTTTIEYISYQTDATKFNLEEQNLDVILKFEALPTTPTGSIRSWDAIEDKYGRLLAYEVE